MSPDKTGDHSRWALFASGPCAPCAGELTLQTACSAQGTVRGEQTALKGKRANQEMAWKAKARWTRVDLEIRAHLVLMKTG